MVYQDAFLKYTELNQHLYPKKGERTMGKVQTVKRKSTVRERPSAIAYMLNEARKEINSNEYSIFGGAKSVVVKKCPQCGKPSLVGCISKDKEFIIALCFFRYNKNEKARCMHHKKWPNRKVEEDKANAQATPNEEV